MKRLLKSLFYLLGNSIFIIEQKNMFKTLSYKYTPSKQERSMLRFLWHISKNLYNSTLYELRQNYFKTKKIISYYELNKILKTNENFHILNIYTSICIIRNAHTTFSNFVKGYTKLPKYLKPNDYYLLYTEQIKPILAENKLINKFIKESRIKESFNIYLRIPKIINTDINGALNIKVKLVDMIYYHS